MILFPPIAAVDPEIPERILEKESAEARIGQKISVGIRAHVPNPIDVWKANLLNGQRRVVRKDHAPRAQRRVAPHGHTDSNANVEISATVVEARPEELQCGRFRVRLKPVLK